VQGIQGDQGIQGIQGETGDTGSQGIQGEKGMNWQGEWSSGEYQIDDTVEYLGTSYIATAITTETPSISATNWDVVALKGTDGAGAGNLLSDGSIPMDGGYSPANPQDIATRAYIDQGASFAVYNPSGSIMVAGSPVYPNGDIVGGVTSVTLAQADSHDNLGNEIFVLAEDIGTLSPGQAKRDGAVFNVDTDAFTAGDLLWISPTVAGEYVNVMPEFPNYPIQVGAVIVKSATAGILGLIIAGSTHDTFENFWN
ncbi:unnamed protein product, partial [marine sediment metagenome]